MRTPWSSTVTVSQRPMTALMSCSTRSNVTVPSRSRLRTAIVSAFSWSVSLASGRGQAEGLEQRAAALARASLALAIRARPGERRREPGRRQPMGADEHVLEHRVLTEERRRLERPGDPAPANLRWRQPGNALALEEDLARAEPDHAGDQVEDRALAGSVGADETVDRSRRHRHRQIRD